MKIRLADYVADFLADHGVTDVFTVVGGGAMHLNDAIGHNKRLNVIYNHHEQACAMAAEAYARIDNKIAGLCVTTGPGGLNALTGVAGGWLDSIPMFVVSGQVRYDTTVSYTEKFTEGFPLRSVGDQEYEIIKSVKAMTKYAVMIEDAKTIRYDLEKAWHLATTGRPGPVWIDIPLNFQAMMIEPDELTGYDPAEDDKDLAPAVTNETIKTVVEMLKNAKRPAFYAGYGIRLSGGYDVFRKVMEKLNIPVVTYWNAIDLIETEHPLYVGRAGNMGDRPGNWAIQNADVILAIGTRLSTRQTSLNWKTWARDAKTIMVNVDRGEMKKHTLHDIIPVWADAKNFLEELDKELDKELNHKTAASTAEEFCDKSGLAHASKLCTRNEWISTCQNWKKDYPVVTNHQKRDYDYVNVYAAFDYLSSKLPENSLTAVSNGACCVAGHQTWNIQKGSRFANNNAIASMGYGLPAAIGTCAAGGFRETICLEGDGSIMMNLQELQTIISYNMPIKIFMINNKGYHSIRITQTNIFNKQFTGIGPESEYPKFPEYRKIAEAFGFKYYSAHTNSEMRDVVDEVLSTEGPVFVEFYTDTDQVWEPKSGAKKLPDGSLTSPALEDMAPFIPRDQLQKMMYIQLMEEE